MEKVVCLNGHEFDAEKLEFCPRCGAPAAGSGEGDAFGGFDGFDGFDGFGGDSPDQPAPFRTVFMPADEAAAAAPPPPIRTIGGGEHNEPAPPPPPARSMKVAPQPQAGNARPGAAAHAPVQPNSNRPTPAQRVQSQPMPGQPAPYGQPAPQPAPAPAVHGQNAQFMNRPPMGQRVQSQPLPGQPVPYGQPVPQQPAPAPAVHGQSGQFMNRPPMGQPVQSQPMPGQPAPYGQPAQYMNPPQMGQPFPQQNVDLGGIAMTAQMSPDMLMPPPISPADSDKTVALSYEETNTSLPVGCLIVLNGQSKGEMYKLRHGRNIIGRNGKGQEFAVDLKFNKKIHRAPQAVISYDPAARGYSLIPCSGSLNPVYLNGSAEPLRGAAALNSYDRILIEGTALLFIGFCGDAFSWELL